MLEGTVDTPFGGMKKQNLMIAGGAVVIFAIVYYRNQKAKNAAASAGSPEIDPATGYPFGSAEDAASLQQQANYVSPGGGGGSSSSGSTGGFVTNAEWSQAVVQYVRDHDLGDAGTMAQALGTYLAGQYADSATQSLIQQAVAIEGYPPVSGSNGYPPHINTTNPNGGGSSGKTVKPGFSLSVSAGEKVETFNAQIKARDGVAVDWSLLEQTNPGLHGNIKWVSDINSRYFLKAATYYVPPVEA